ncbi:hypothetical protein OHV05_18115 [Kitasatospora sp. NBC_00070]|uniref:hypothetical protein n=1 Tax=Kitasatospora sp. NBC_00070 TaxID=2975962 RepID=UPI003256520C
MTKAAVAGVVLAGLLVTGCSAGSGGGSAPPGAAPAPTVCASPKPTSSWLGGSTEGLPEDVRCLPHVADGDLLVAPPLADGTVVEGRSMTVHVTEGTTRAESLALCRRLTDLGYGTGGRHGLSILGVGGAEEAGQYVSMPNRPPCEQIR